MRTFAQKPKAIQQTEAAKSTKPSRPLSGQSCDVHSILQLQRTIGNQTEQRLLQSNAEELQVGSATTTASTRFGHDFSRIPIFSPLSVQVQPKLTISAPGDMYEQEADIIADQIVRMPEPQLQHSCPCGEGCPKCQTEQLVSSAHSVNHLSDGRDQEAGQIVERVMQMPHRPSATDSGQATTSVGGLQSPEPAATAGFAARLAAERGRGGSLQPNIRQLMEPRFGLDFSAVRVHTDSRAQRLAADLHAHAFTFGNDIFFGVNKWNPASAPGRRLIAHELAHTVQQSGNAPRIQRLSISIHPLDPGSFTTKSAKAFYEIPATSRGLARGHGAGFTEHKRKWGSECVSSGDKWRVNFNVAAMFQIYLDKDAFSQLNTNLRGLNTLKGALGHEQRHVLNYLNFYARWLPRLLASERKYSDSKSCSQAADKALKEMNNAFERFKTLEMQHKNGNPANNTGYYPIASGSPFDFLKILTGLPNPRLKSDVDLEPREK